MAVGTGTAMLIAAGAGTAGTIYAANKDQKIQESNIASAERQKQQSLEFIEKSIERARGDLFKLFPAAQESRQKSMQFGLDLMQQTIPAQLDLYRQGNMNAQQAIADGYAPRISALTGGLQAPYSPQVRGTTMPTINMPDLPTPTRFPVGDQAGSPAGLPMVVDGTGVATVSEAPRSDYG